jgi:hypothetical protein
MKEQSSIGGKDAPGGTWRLLVVAGALVAAGLAIMAWTSSDPPGRARSDGKDMTIQQRSG